MGSWVRPASFMRDATACSSALFDTWHHCCQLSIKLTHTALACRCIGALLFLAVAGVIVIIVLKVWLGGTAPCTGTL
jgi:uncharacterized membrane protein